MWCCSQGSAEPENAANEGTQQQWRETEEAPAMHATGETCLTAAWAQTRPTPNRTVVSGRVAPHCICSDNSPPNLSDKEARVVQRPLGLLLPLPPLYVSASVIAPVVEKLQFVAQLSFHNLSTSRNLHSSENMAGIILKHVLSNKAAAKQPLRFFSPQVYSHKPATAVRA